MAGWAPRRGVLSGVWTFVVVLWYGCAGIVWQVTAVICGGGDGGQPWTDPNSQLGHYCGTVEPFVWEARGLFVGVWMLAAIGAYSIWKRRGGLLIAVGAIAFALLGAHLVTLLTLWS